MIDSPLHQVFWAASLCFHLVLVAWQRLVLSCSVICQSLVSVTDRPPRLGLQLPIATAMGSPHTHGFPSCLTPELCLHCHIGIGCCDSYGASMGCQGWLVAWCSVAVEKPEHQGYATQHIGDLAHVKGVCWYGLIILRHILFSIVPEQGRSGFSKVL